MLDPAAATSGPVLQGPERVVDDNVASISMAQLGSNRIQFVGIKSTRFAADGVRARAPV